MIRMHTQLKFYQEIEMFEAHPNGAVIRKCKIRKPFITVPNILVVRRWWFRADWKVGWEIQILFQFDVNCMWMEKKEVPQEKKLGFSPVTQEEWSSGTNFSDV